MKNNNHNNIKILQKIGQGQHGSIYKVQYLINDKKSYAALKRVTLQSKLSNDFQFSSLNKLNHPNIIKIMECKEIIQQNQRDFSFQILLEYASQSTLIPITGDLSTYTKQKYDKTMIPQQQLLKWLCQICLGLHYLHNDMSILHRDIKTKNILVMENGLLKIADFGTARQLTKNQQFAMTSVGTPYYLSPEAVKGPRYNSKSDIWGLGCIMFQLCTGKKPFQGNNLNDLIKQILSSQIEQINQMYTEEFRNLIKSMLEKNPQKRPSIQNILEKNQIREIFCKVKEEFYQDYKDFIYPISELKTKKYCQKRQDRSILSFCNQSLKTAKYEKNIKLQIFQWNHQYKCKSKKQQKLADLTKLKNRSLKSIIEKRKNQKKDLEDIDKSFQIDKK